MTDVVNRAVKLLKDATKIVESDRRASMNTDQKLKTMQFRFTSGNGTVNAIFVVKKTQEEYQKKLHQCFVDTKKGFDKVTKK